MKKTSKPDGVRKPEDDMRAEYRLDYSKAKPNRFAKPASQGSVAVLLDPDVAAVFRDAHDVNNVLRALMKTMPDIGRIGRRSPSSRA